MFHYDTTAQPIHGGGTKIYEGSSYLHILVSNTISISNDVRVVK
jgi:hypothetical protein